MSKQVVSPYSNKPITDALTIKIWASSEEGFMYDIYDTEDVDEDAESIDGGCCTGTLSDAIEMATIQAREMVQDLELEN